MNRHYDYEFSGFDSFNDYGYYLDYTEVKSLMAEKNLDYLLAPRMQFTYADVNNIDGEVMLMDTA